MADHVFKSYEEFLQKMTESKEAYERKVLQLSWEEKIKIVVKLQEKAYAAGWTKVKPWPVK